MWGFHTDYLFLMSLWTIVTVLGMLLYMGLERQGFLLISPLAAMIGSGWVLWNHSVDDGPLNIGVFFLFNLGLMHLLFSMMLDRHATGLKIKVVGAVSMVLTGWAYFTDGPWLFVTLWGLSVIPQLVSFNRKEQIQARRIYIAHHVLSLFCLIFALMLLAPANGVPWSIDTIAQASETYQGHAATVLLVIAAFIRQGIFPFHLWFKASYKTRPFPLNMGLYVGNLGFLLFLKVIMPLMESHTHDMFPWLLGWCILSGLYFANMSLVQERIRSTVFYVMLAQFSTLFCGLEAESVTGQAGVLFQFLSLGLAFAGLIACLYLMEWNLGELHARRFHGLQQRNPTLSLFFLLFSLCAVALPFTMGFAGEDLIFHAVIEKYPMVGLGLILTAAINGISLFRVVTFLFRGKRNDLRDDTIAFGFWQKAALATLLVMLFGFGLMPNLLLKHVLAFL